MQPDPTSDLISDLFVDDAAARKRARTALSAHADPKVAAFFVADKCGYHSLRDGAKLAKVLQGFDALGINGARVAMTVLRRLATSPDPAFVAYVTEPFLDAALRYPGLEAEVFEALATARQVYLPPPKKALPPGLSRLRALEHLRVPAGRIKSAANIDELAAIPQPFELALWVDDVDLELWSAASQNVSGIWFRGRTSNLSSVAPLAPWSALRAVDVESTGVTRVAPVAHLPLEHLNVNETAVADLSCVAGMKTLKRLRLRRTKVADFSVLAGLTALEDLELSFTSITDLSALRDLRALHRLHLWGTRVTSLEPIVDLPLEWIDLNHAARPDLSPLARIPTLKHVSLSGARDNEPGLQALTAARPDVFVSR